MASDESSERLRYGVVDSRRVLVGEPVAGEVDGEHLEALEVDPGHEGVEGRGVVQPAVDGQDRSVSGAPEPACTLT